MKTNEIIIKESINKPDEVAFFTTQTWKRRWVITKLPLDMILNPESWIDEVDDYDYWDIGNKRDKNKRIVYILIETNKNNINTYYVREMVI